MPRLFIPLLVVMLAVSVFDSASRRVFGQIHVFPDRILLDSPEASQQILVGADVGKGRTNDLSRTVSYEISPAGGRHG